MSCMLERAGPLAGLLRRDGLASAPGRALRTGQARRVAFDGPAFLVDLSPLERRLVCGSGAPGYLAAAGLPVPALCAWAPYGRDGFVARTGLREWLVVAGGATALPALPGGTGDVLVLDHECVELALGGSATRRMFGELTGTDLGQFAAGAYVPVLLAGNECWLRALPVPHRHWRICCAPAEAAFLFGTLLELVREADGALFGLEDFLSACLNEEDQS